MIYDKDAYRNSIIILFFGLIIIGACIGLFPDSIFTPFIVLATGAFVIIELYVMNKNRTVFNNDPEITNQNEIVK